MDDGASREVGSVDTDEEPPAATPPAACGMFDGAGTVMVFPRQIARADVPALCERVRTALRFSDTGLVVCDVGGLTDPDLVTVDALARMQLVARQSGGRIRLRRVPRALDALLVLTGLTGTLGGS